MAIDTTLRLAYTVSKRDVYRYPAGYVFLRICIRPPENFIPMARSNSPTSANIATSRLFCSSKNHEMRGRHTARINRPHRPSWTGWQLSTSAICAPARQTNASFLPSDSKARLLRRIQPTELTHPCARTPDSALRVGFRYVSNPFVARVCYFMRLPVSRDFSY